MVRKAGGPPDPKLEEYMRRYGLSKRQVYALGGVERLDAMTHDARQVLVNSLNTKRPA